MRVFLESPCQKTCFKTILLPPLAALSFFLRAGVAIPVLIYNNNCRESGAQTKNKFKDQVDLSIQALWISEDCQNGPGHAPYTFFGRTFWRLYAAPKSTIRTETFCGHILLAFSKPPKSILQKLQKVSYKKLQKVPSKSSKKWLTKLQECFTKSPKNPNIPRDLPDEISQFSSEINSFGEILPDEKTDNSAQKLMLFETFWQMKAHNSPQKLMLSERFCQSDSAPQMKLFFLSTLKKYDYSENIFR